MERETYICSEYVAKCKKMPEQNEANTVMPICMRFVQVLL